MIITIENLLPPESLEMIQKYLKNLTWQDGKKTAGGTAKQVKQNLQANLNSNGGQDIKDAVFSSINKNAVFTAFAQPKRFSNLLVSQTSDGGHYGLHNDNAIMQKDGRPMRTDLSFTIALNSPTEYEGGELTIHTAGMVQSFRPQIGECVIYPTSALHEVTPVTSGERIVSVGWVESLVQDPAERELLFDITNLKVNLRRHLKANSIEMLTLDKINANLVRMWAKP